MAYGFGGGFGGGNIQQLMRQAQQMQQKMQAAQEEVDNTEFSSVVGGGMVEIKMMGNYKVTSLSIKPEVIDPEDVEMLEDLVVSAINDVIAKIDIAKKENIPQIPGM